MSAMSGPWLAFILLVGSCFLALELYGLLRYGSSGTLSDHIRYWNQLHPLVGFAMGYALGILTWHFFVSVNP